MGVVRGCTVVRVVRGLFPPKTLHRPDTGFSFLVTSRFSALTSKYFALVRHDVQLLFSLLRTLRTCKCEQRVF